jgi:hypothetical protein
MINLQLLYKTVGVLKFLKVYFCIVLFLFQFLLKISNLLIEIVDPDVEPPHLSRSFPIVEIFYIGIWARICLSGLL